MSCVTLVMRALGCRGSPDKPCSPFAVRRGWTAVGKRGNCGRVELAGRHFGQIGLRGRCEPGRPVERLSRRDLTRPLRSPNAASESGTSWPVPAAALRLAMKPFNVMSQPRSAASVATLATVDRPAKSARPLRNSARAYPPANRIAAMKSLRDLVTANLLEKVVTARPPAWRPRSVALATGSSVNCPAGTAARPAQTVLLLRRGGRGGSRESRSAQN